MQRGRFKRKATGSNHDLTKRDIKWLAFLHRHGGRLPTSFIHDFTKEEFKNLQATQVRLKHLFHEVGVLDRPWQQKETEKPLRNELIHQINKKGLDILKDEGIFSEYAPTMHGAFKHQVFLSCVSASLELNCKGTDLEFIPQHELQTDINIPVDGETVKPDLVCKIKKDGKELLLFVEVDRGTEATVSHSNRKSWNSSIRQYKRLIGDNLFKNYFDTNNGALLLVITVSKAKQEGILKVIGKSNYILTQSYPQFGREFKPPTELDLLGTYWERAGHTPFKMK